MNQNEFMLRYNRYQDMACANCNQRFGLHMAHETPFCPYIGDREQTWDFKTEFACEGYEPLTAQKPASAVKEHVQAAVKKLPKPRGKGARK